MSIHQDNIHLSSSLEETKLNTELVEIKAVCTIDIHRVQQAHHDHEYSANKIDSAVSTSVASSTPPFLASDSDNDIPSSDPDDDCMTHSSSQPRSASSDGSNGIEDSLFPIPLPLDVYYPSDPDLPWHFCWVDDGMIGGMSAPVEKYHWPAMERENVGLVVNLTEGLVGPVLSSPCSDCEYMNEKVPHDLFDDMKDPNSIQVLFIPVRDGNIPRWEQLELFLKHANQTIQNGKKVVIHCQAGVGRTGTFLAVYIMEKYRCTPDEAISRLRSVRPQSMQFHRIDYQSTPFRQYPAQQYIRNLFQERFIERYHERFITTHQPPTTTKTKNFLRPFLKKNERILSSVTGMSPELQFYVDKEINERIKTFQNAPHVKFSCMNRSKCAACNHVLAWGPHSIAQLTGKDHS